MAKPPQLPPEVPNHWNVYFAVEDTDKAIEHIKSLGGELVMGPMDVEPGRFADFIAVDGSPLADIGVLQDRRRLRGVYIAGREYRMADRPYDPRQVTDFALSNWTDLYTRARVAELRGRRPRLEAAE